MNQTTSFPLNNLSFEKLSFEIADNIENLLDYFGIEYKIGRKTYFGCCPIHNGDNKRAWHVYNGEYPKWSCYTHGCENKYGKDMLGLIVALTFTVDNKKITKYDAAKWYIQWAKKSSSDYYVSDVEISNARFVKMAKVHVIDNVKPKTLITRDIVRKSLKIPSPYYLNRGVLPSIIERYDIGDCLSTDFRKEMYMRAVVPMYNESYEYMMGCSGRSIFPECPKCNLYHNLNHSCPKPENQAFYPKWKHSKTLVKEKTLFNYWFAKPHIMQSNSAILVESPGNVLKLESCGIKCSLASLGTSFSSYQTLMLSSSGCMNVIVIGDNDDAGRKYMQTLDETLNRQFNVHKINISGSDIGEMKEKQVLDELWPTLKKLHIEIKR